MTDRTAPAKEASVELLPCPFCGQEGAVRLMDNIKNHWRVLCMNDECDIGPFAEHFGRAEAVTAWNRRSSPVREGRGQATPKTASHPSPASSAWRPIASAPKDGSVIDLWCVDSDGDGYRYPSCWWGEVQHECQSQYCDTCADIPSGEGWLDAMCAHHSFLDGKPSHWQPLPSPPEVESAATHEMGASGAEGDQASPSLSPSEPSGRGESGGIQGPSSEASMNKGEG